MQRYKFYLFIHIKAAKQSFKRISCRSDTNCFQRDPVANYLPKLSTVIYYILFIFNLKLKYNEYNILLKQLIHFRYNICLLDY